MSKQTVLLVGATGETGSAILEGLLEDGNFNITCLIRPSSISKPSIQALKDRDVNVVVGDLNGNLDALINILKGHNTVISAIGPAALDQELRLVDAAAAAGTKRFVPCTFATICPPGGIMLLRDDKEKVINRISSHHLPYTVVDCGFWYQLSWFRLPSGKLDYATASQSNIWFGEGDVRNIMTDKRDIGRVMARIVVDERTRNKFVFMAGAVMSQREVLQLEQRMSGETPVVEHMSKDQLRQRMESSKAELAREPGDFLKRIALFGDQYNYSMHIRGDNTPEVANYLGYLDARALYPDFKYIGFAEYFQELLEGKAKKPYAGRHGIAE